MRTYHLAVIAALFVASPALAGPREDAGCVVGRLSAADIAVIVDETLAGGSQATIGRLVGPIGICSEGQSWTPDRRANAAGYSIGIVVHRVLHDRLRAESIDTAALDRWFARQSIDFRTTAFTSMSQAELELAFATLAGREVTAEALERHGGIIGGYISALVIMERIERGLGL
jgi:hypothetical protein